MTSSLSSAKRVRQNAKRRANNRTKISAMKTAMRSADDALRVGRLLSRTHRRSCFYRAVRQPYYVGTA